jgi:DNA-binding phage protein
MTTKTRKEIAAEIGVTEEQLNAVFDALDELDPKERAQLIKAAHDLEKFARETGMTVEELCRTASTRQH